jgi:hypothetical protein|tara:strand:- start:503 stop:742 length:240 start_codon:yes stop_codon:yes gene_type:complete
MDLIIKKYKMKKPKERTLNELRQVKSYVHESSVVVNNFKEVNIDSQYIVELIEKYKNDQELGQEVRFYYLNLKDLNEKS